MERPADSRLRGRRSWSRLPHRARGLVLIAAVAVVLLLALHATIASLHAAIPSQREGLSLEALRDAKAALIAFAADNRYRPGGLPCPDRDGDGQAELQCDTPVQRVGLLPWRTLKTGDLRDGAGEPLWYALSAGFRNDASIAISSLTAGELSLAVSGTGISSGEAGLVALVIAPGRALPGQSRSGRQTADRAAFLEGENATGTTRFRTFTPQDSGNDRVEPLTAGELFAIVDRVVAARVRREIAPLLVERYVDAWGGFPFAVPFEEPARSALVDETRGRGRHGLLPANPAATTAVWHPASVIVRQIGGAGRIVQTDCTRTIGTEIRCMLDYSGPVDVSLEATATGVGYALVQPPSTADADFGPPGLLAKRIEPHAVAADGSAAISAYARLPATSNRIRLSLRAPMPIPELTDPRLPAGDPTAWFTRNEWYRTLYLVVANGSGASSDCAARGHCLVIRMQDRDIGAPAALVFMGRARDVPHDAPLLHRYLEGENRDPALGLLRNPPSLERGNDAVAPLCPAAARGCGGRA